MPVPDKSIIGLVATREGRVETVPVRHITLTPLMPGQTLVGVVEGDGLLQARIVNHFTPHGADTWGCAVCEQLHPIAVTECPLTRGPVVSVAIGPYALDGEDIYICGKELALTGDQHHA